MHMIYDQAKQKWAIYRRIIPEFSERMIADESDRERKAVDRYYRSYAYAESDDLREWKNHQFILSMDADDPADTELYQFGCHKIGQTYVGYMSVFICGSRNRSIFISPPAATGSTSPASAGASRSSRPGRWDITTSWRWPAPNPSRSSSTIRSTSITPRPTFRTAWTWHAPIPDAPGRRGAGHVQARPVCLPGNQRADPGPCRVVTKPFTVRHSKLFLNAATWMKGSIRVGGVDARLAADSRLHRAAGARRPGRRPRPSGPLERQRRREQAAGEGDPPQVLYDSARIHAMTLSNEDRKLGAVEGEYRDEKPGGSAPRVN